MVDIEHGGIHVEASVLLTIPEVQNLNSFCTIEYLTPIKFKSGNICYSGPITNSNLVLISCPNSKQIVSTEALNKCYQDSSAFICPTNILTVATNISWLGFPFHPDAKLTFPRYHVRAKDCTNLHPLIHLGGRSFLATMAATLPLSTGPMTTSPLTVYHIPCNASFVGMATGLDHCPERLSVSIPLSTASSMQFIPWSAAAPNMSQTIFTHPVFDIPTPANLNKSVLADLDSTFTALDGQLLNSITATNESIAQLHTESSLEITDYVAGFALGFGLFNSVTLTVLLFYIRQHGSFGRRSRNCPRCHLRSRTTTAAHNRSPESHGIQLQCHNDTPVSGHPSKEPVP